ncbi:MAG: rhodanese-like domain-containing protein [Burkholderiales bacterium]
MLLWPLVRRGTGGPWVNTVEATQLMNRKNALVIDVRDAAEYEKGHILGAKSFPLADLERRMEDLARHKSKPLIVDCGGGHRRTGAVPILRKHGFGDVYSLSGGYAAWQQAGLPVEK